MAIANGHVWVTVETALRALQGGPPGGTLRLTAQGDVDSMDPALLTPTARRSCSTRPARSCSTTRTSLPPGATQLVPGGGRSPADPLRRREDLHLHDPQGLSLLAALERARHGTDVQVHDRAQPEPEDERPRSDQQWLPGDIVRRQGLHGRQGAHVSGVVARGNRLTIRLVAPAPDFVTVIALPFFCAVPIGTPLDPKGVRLVPSGRALLRRLVHPRAGSGTEAKSQLPRRPPSSTGPHRAHRRQSPRRTAVRQIEAGTADYALDGIPPAMAAGARRHTTGLEARRRRTAGSSTSSTRIAWLDYIALNTHRPLFRDVRMRKAVNYALDRRSLARLGDFGSPFPDRADRPVPAARDRGLHRRPRLPAQPGSGHRQTAGREEAAQRRALHLQPLRL